MERQPISETARIANARKAIENGKKAREERTLFDLRTHYKAMSRSFGRQNART